MENYGNYQARSGFSIIELLLIMGIFAILSGFIVTNMIRSQTSASVDSSASVLVADFRSQQLKTMGGDSEGQSTAQSYGIHFETNTYTVFRGSTYSSGDTSNFVVNLDTNMQFTSVTFPSSQVVFVRRNGEVSGFVNGSNSVTVTNTQSGEQKAIALNKYGVPTIQ